MIEVKQEYISKAINNLFHLLGVKENIPCDLVREPVCRGKIEECIKTIADYLGLPIKINLSYVPASYVAPQSPTYRESERFVSQSLTKSYGKRRNGAGITAQVSIPSYLPLYGTSGLIDFPIDVKISEDAQEYPNTFIAVMAHELSHIVLYSLQHSEKDNEVYTDIAAMLLGFNEVIKDGRKTEKTHVEHSLFSTTTITETATYGYLSDDSFRFAHSEINKILQKNRNAKKKFLNQSNSLHKRLKALKKDVLKFKNYLEILDKSHKMDIEPSEAQKIVSFHKFGYLEEIENFIDVTQKELEKRRKYKVMRHFFCDWFDNLNGKLASISSNIEQKEMSLGEDLRVLKRNVDFFTKLRTNAKVFLKGS